ncbi:MAG: hypothetical protein JNK86_07970 [Alphaproteobacteria bacterium]|nr:hypothetical protein [Alphaproteobacteria bacterium]
MKHPALVLVFLALSLLAACQSKEAYFAKLDAWKGKSESALLAERGAPDQFFESEGVRYLTYNSSSLNGEKPRVSCSSSSFNGFSASTSCNQLYCREVFKIEKAKITEISYEGNNCL